MTMEEMEAVAQKVVDSLNHAGIGGITNAEYLKQDAKPGEPLPIMFELGDDAFVLELNLA